MSQSNKKIPLKPIPIGLAMDIGYTHPTKDHLFVDRALYEHFYKRLLKLVDKKRPVYRKMDVNEVMAFAENFTENLYDGITGLQRSDMQDLLRELQERVKTATILDHN